MTINTPVLPTPALHVTKIRNESIRMKVGQIFLLVTEDKYSLENFNFTCNEPQLVLHLMDLLA
jgi:hypothetical protein